MHHHDSPRGSGQAAASASSESAQWQPAALVAVVCLVIAIVLLPSLLGGHLQQKAVLPLLQGFFWVGMVAFAIVAMVRFATANAHHTGPFNDMVAPLSEFVAPLSEFVRDRGHASPSNVTALSHSQLRTGAYDGGGVRPTEWSLGVIDRMEWKRFEDLCCAFYIEKGIKAATTRLGADGGVDIRLYQDPDDSDRCTAIVQCKAWGQPVGVKTVRELRGVMAHENIERAFFMAPNGFTDNAKEFAAANRITLLDGRLILAMLQRLPATSRWRLLTQATEGDWTTPTCPSCGSSMTPRQGSRGPFWGCSNYPRCRAKLSMRSTAPLSSVANG